MKPWYNTNMPATSGYKNIIWTNHVLQRLNDRNIPQELAWKAFRYPDKSMPGNSSHTTEFVKRIDERTVTIVATQNSKREWIILSCWVHPPFAGSIDIKKKKAYLQYKHSSLTGKIWIRLKQALGLYDSF